MASGAAQAVKGPTDWQAVEPSDWQEVTQAPAPSAPAPSAPGFLESLGHTFGIGKEEEAQRQAHPLRSLVEGMPGVAPLEGLATGAKRIGGELVQAGKDAIGGNPAAAAVHGISAIPFIGPGMMKASEQAPASTPGESYMSRIGDVATSPGAMGTLIGTAIQAAPLLAGSRLTAAPAEAITEGMKRGGEGILNRTVGATKPDFSHGANPGAGYLAGGGGPAFTMGGLARNAETVRAKAGTGLGKLYDDAQQGGMRFPANNVASELEKPLSAYESEQEGPGSTGVSPLIGEYRARLQPQPNPAAIGTEGYTPRGLFDLKKSIAKQARWNSQDPVGLNDVRQEQVGRLGGMLTDMIPEAKPLNQVYQGALRFGNRAEQRAATGSAPLTQIGRRAFESGVGGLGYMTGHPIAGLVPLAADTIPVKTSTGWALYRGGSGLGAKLPAALRPVPAIAGINNEKPEKKSNNEK